MSVGFARPHDRSLALARRRARARAKSDGAAMFIVAITLGLLAAMGLYGLTATSADIRAAGHLRESLQGQKAGEHAVTSTAETFNPSTAKGLVETMMAGTGKQTTDCKSAAPYTGSASNAAATNVSTQAAEACIRLSAKEMENIAAGVNAWTSTPYTSKSFGDVVNQPFVKVEVTNPVDIAPPPGSGLDPSRQRYAQVTATVYVEMKSALNVPAETMVLGRGRLTVGPITGAAARY